MAKSLMVASLVAATALCFSVVLTAAHDKPLHDENMFVEGHVYCDPCGVEFQTRISTPITGVRVHLTCRGRDNDTVTYKMEGVTNSKGLYSLPVEGEHEDDICEVRLGGGHAGDCRVPFKTAVDCARVLLTKNVGVVTPIRSASALGYKTPGADKRCQQVLLDMGFPPLDASQMLDFSFHY